jgi:hypothetical protein
MSRSILKYCINVAFVFLAFSSWAQADSTGTKFPDSLKVKSRYLPTGLRIGTDLITGIKGYRNATFDGWEVNADVDFDRYYLAIDYGRWAQGANLPNGWYNNDGKYVRFGFDVNMLKKDPDRNMFFIGLRYAHASFSDSTAFTFTDDNFGQIQKNIVETNLTANWMEITSGLRVKIWKYFWMGYTIRLKFSPKVHGVKELQPWDIPGYGVSARTVYWGFNYQIFFKIPVRKEPKMLIIK